MLTRHCVGAGVFLQGHSEVCDARGGESLAKGRSTIHQRTSDVSLSYLQWMSATVVAKRGSQRMKRFSFQEGRCDLDFTVSYTKSWNQGTVGAYLHYVDIHTLHKLDFYPCPTGYNT